MLSDSIFQALNDVFESIKNYDDYSHYHKDDLVEIIANMYVLILKLDSGPAYLVEREDIYEKLKKRAYEQIEAIYRDEDPFSVPFDIQYKKNNEWDAEKEWKKICKRVEEKYPEKFQSLNPE